MQLKARSHPGDRWPAVPNQISPPHWPWSWEKAFLPWWTFARVIMLQPVWVGKPICFENLALSGGKRVGQGISHTSFIFLWVILCFSSGYLLLFLQHSLLPLMTDQRSGILPSEFWDLVMAQSSSNYFYFIFKIVSEGNGMVLIWLIHIIIFSLLEFFFFYCLVWQNSWFSLG